MTKIRSFEELKKIREKQRTVWLAPDKGKTDERPVQVKVAMATCGIASGARDVMEFMDGALEKRGVNAIVSPVGCMGYCYAEPTVEVTLPGKDPVVFAYVDREKADMIIEKFIKTGELVPGVIPVNYEKIENTTAR